MNSKHTLNRPYDALLHVPMIWFAPGLIKQGLIVEDMAQGVDIFPTIVDLSEGEIPEGLSGRSLKPFLLEENHLKEDFAVFASAGYGEVEPKFLKETATPYDDEENIPLHTRAMKSPMSNIYKTAMVRTRNWKFIQSESRSPELYKMDNGWIERENLIDKPEYANTRRALEKKIAEIWKW